VTERYLKVLHRRRIKSILFALFGAVILAALLVSDGSIVPEYTQAFFVGTGFAWIANGVVNFYRKGKLLQDKEALRKAAIAEFDERTSEVMRRTCTLTLNVLLALIYAAMISASYISQTICYTLFAVLCAGLVIWFTCYVIIWKAS